jgi:phosphatidylserine/phosphatidylglycerophosphate/cardiolipin synthase-like enzyme
MTGKITNPLANVTDIPLTDAYREVVAYGPDDDTDFAAGYPTTEGFSTYQGWEILAETHRTVQATWDGSVFIGADQGSGLVTLCLTLDNLPPEAGMDGIDDWIGGSLQEALEDNATGATPRFVFYRNIEYATLEATLDPEGTRTRDELDRFLDLDAVGVNPGKLPVRTGAAIGLVGEAEMPDGTAGWYLELQMSVDLVGTAPVSPAALYATVDRGLADRWLNGDEYDLTTSIWSADATTPRAVLWVRDEWNHALGRHSAGTINLTRTTGDGGTVVSTVEVDEETGVAIGMAAFAISGVHGDALGLTLSVEGATTGEAYYLSQVPSRAIAATGLTLDLELPCEVVVQALDAHAWFPAQGGVGWDIIVGAFEVELVEPPERFTNNNLVTPLVDGFGYYQDLEVELAKLNASSHFLCHANWWLDHDFVMQHLYNPTRGLYEQIPPTGMTMGDYWEQCRSGAVPVFALLWSAPGGPHSAIIDLPPDEAIRALFEYAASTGYTETLQWFLENYVEFGIAPHDDALEALCDEWPTNRTRQGILDARHRPMASHHQKICVLKNDDGLVAYLGGIDINENRTNSTLHWDHLKGAEPYHDVQCKLEGPAAKDVLKTFISRWNDFPTGSSATPGNRKQDDIQCDELGFTADGYELWITDEHVRTGADHTNLVQVARTFGNTKGMSGITIQNAGTFTDDDGYAFAPDGDFTIESAILGAIRRAKKYIYIEDQYLANLKIATAVADKIAERKAAIAAEWAAPTGEEELDFFVGIVIPRFEKSSTLTDSVVKLWAAAQAAGGPIPLAAAAALASEVPDVTKIDSVWGYTQSRWHDMLTDVDASQEHWGIYCICLPTYKESTLDSEPWATVTGMTLPPDERYIYVHAKTVIVDDVWATIGSANMGWRSYTNDSEINACFIDGSVDSLGRRISVRDYRAALWAEHLRTEPASWFRARAGNDPEVLEKLREITAGKHDPRDTGGAGGLPAGNRLYAWPVAESYVAAATSPTIRFYEEDGETPDPLGTISEIPVYWWTNEEYGKLPWSGDIDDITPPAIGSDAFAFDGDDGSDYVAFDLQ